MGSSLSETIAKAERDNIIQSNPYDRRLRGMEQVIKMQRNKVLFAQKEVMKDPTSLEANIKWIWGLICSGKVKQAVQAFDLLQKKQASGLIRDSDATRDEFEKLQKIISAISGKSLPNPEESAILD